MISRCFKRGWLKWPYSNAEHINMHTRKGSQMLLFELTNNDAQQKAIAKVHVLSSQQLRFSFICSSLL